ncbi:MAG TPA: hypothetical protein VMR54_05255 [Thermoanaerobaculia bacterium]|nr:hypothetical protein [Thermoanaerobaculia bacterium]
MLKKILIAVGLLVAAVLAYGLISFGPRNVIGMLRYDQRREGDLKVGDRAPDVSLLALDGTTPVSLKDSVGGKPLVLIFGSFT